MTNNKDNGLTSRDILLEDVLPRLDSINERLSKGSGKIAENRTAIYYIKWILGGIFFCLIVIFERIFNSHP